jgi:hypothetical protein
MANNYQEYQDRIFRELEELAKLAGQAEAEEEIRMRELTKALQELNPKLSEEKARNIAMLVEKCRSHS